MARFRIRYRNTDLEMPLGEFVVGRSASCHLALEDALVSRRHAVLRSTEDAVVIEDLGSRNGVLVNGQRIAAPTRLAHGDLVTIGEHELRMLDRHARPPSDPGWATREARFADASRRTEKRTAEIDLRQLAGGALERSESDGARELAAFRLVAGIAEKSLGLGRFDEAERIVGRHLDAALARAASGAALADEAFDMSVEYALRLAEGPRAARFLGYVVELHTAARKLMAEGTIDRLHELVRKTRYGERGPIDAYIALLEARSGELSVAERFIVRRVTALKRVISA